MKIVVRNSDEAIVMVAECENTPTPAGDFTVHDVPDWDWSIADVAGVDKSDTNWIENQMQWDGATLVPKP